MFSRKPGGEAVGSIEIISPTKPETNDTKDRFILWGIKKAYDFYSKSGSSRKILKKSWKPFFSVVNKAISRHAHTELVRRRPYILDTATEYDSELNLLRKPMDKIIMQAIQIYEQSKPNRPKVNRHATIQSDYEDFVSNLYHIVTEEEALKDPEGLLTSGKTNLACLTEFALISPTEIALLPDKFPSIFPTSIASTIISARNIGNSEIINPNIHAIRQHAEQLFDQSGLPVSNAEVLAFALELSNGNLEDAIMGVAQCYKYSTRSETGIGGDYIWTCENISDEWSEYGSFNNLHTEIPPDTPGLVPTVTDHIKGTLRNTFSEKFGDGRFEPDEMPNYDYWMDNRAGTAYHAFWIVSLLKDLPPEIIMLLVSGEYLRFGQKHGMTKFLADMRVVEDLYAIDDLIKSLPVQDHADD